MKIIAGKAEAGELFQRMNETKGDDFIKSIHKHVLKKKIRFPALEHIGSQLYNSIPTKEQLRVTDAIIDLNEIGGNVLAAIILQRRLEKHFQQSFKKSTEYIIAGDQWYVCDIIGERVFGFALLKFPEKTIPALKKFTKHPDKWIVRSVGVAAHYAVKKGLQKKCCEEMFSILLGCASTTDFHTKKGIGWAAKTIAKFHPDIIKNHEPEIQSNEVKQWFRSKIKIGLGRSFKYASRYPG